MHAKILIVDDEDLNLEIIKEYLIDTGKDYDIHEAHDGDEAWAKLQQYDGEEEFDVVLLDRMMPGMNGMDVLHKMNEHISLSHIPVILQTARASSQDVLEGMMAGAFYYLTKPYSESMLLSVVNRAVKDRSLYKKLQNEINSMEGVLGLLQHGVFNFRTLTEARNLSALISNSFPVPTRVLSGLQELMVNAVEHGNLGITYEQKSFYNDAGSWEVEVENRLNSDQYRDKYAVLTLNHDDSLITVTIQDQGKGFDWKNFLDFEPNRIMDNHGRGIAIANKISFDHLEYSDSGRRVTVSVKVDPSAMAA